MKASQGVSMNIFVLLFSLFFQSESFAWYMPRETNTVYRYQCEFQFLEGEGVSENSISCLSNQKLGLVQASYTFYLYGSPWGSNIQKKLNTAMYPNPVCEKIQERAHCDSNPQPKFHLSRWPEGIFQVRVQLSPNPQYGIELYGFAAMPDRSGFCPLGLEKVWAYVAKPDSQEFPLPSNFRNRNGWLNNLEVLTEQEAELASFSVYRSPNLVPCAANGSCVDAVFGERELANTYLYEKTQSPVCVIPRTNLE